mgnify:CR=1
MTGKRVVDHGKLLDYWTKHPEMAAVKVARVFHTTRQNVSLIKKEAPPELQAILGKPKSK